MMSRKDSAVSPVVGVMLMLVVTIIIAAVVSAFAGGLAGNQQKTPQVSLTVKGDIQGIEDTDTTNYVPDYPSADYTTANGLQFENTGGDTFSLGDIQIQLQSLDAMVTLSPGDRINRTEGTDLPAGITVNDGYFKKIGNSSLSDTSIAPGDKFMVYSDNCYDSSGASGAPQGKFITWKPVGASAGFGLELNTKIQYKVIDKASSRVISSGDIYLTQ